MLERGDCDHVLFLTSTRAIDARIMSDAVQETPAIQWRPDVAFPAGSRLRRILAVPGAMLKARRTVLRILEEHRPSLCVGIGAFASVAASMMCARRKVPLALMEQNVVAGRATRFLSRYANVILAGLPLAEHASQGIHCPVVTTGVPVRAAISAVASTRRHEVSRRPSLLIVGGSQGARNMNELVSQVLVAPGVLPDGWTVTHQTGDRDAERYQKLYAPHSHIQARPFVRMENALADADLVISRSGAGILAEIACAGVPSVLIPHPESAGQHQLKNAQYFRDASASLLVEQHAPNAAQHLTQILHDLTRDQDRCRSLAQGASRLACPNAADLAAHELAKLMAFNKKGTAP